jgi:OmpA-OmpF porin, OOP family
MKKTLVGLVLVLASAAVAAQDRGFYVGGHVGQATAKDMCDGLAGSGINCEDSDTAIRIMGGYQFSKNFAAELGYTSGAEVSASAGSLREEITTTTWELVGVGMLPVADRLSLYGKLGVYRAETEDRTNFGFSADETNNDLTFGFGVRYDFTQRLFGRVEWQRYMDVGGGAIGESDVDYISVGLAFKF